MLRTPQEVRGFALGLSFFAFLLSVSLFIGFVQVCESHIRRVKRGNKRRRRELLARLGIVEEKDGSDRRTIAGFFHPYCNAGGGGERVLYEALSHHQKHDPELICVVYTGDVGELPPVTAPAAGDGDAFDAAYRAAGGKVAAAANGAKDASMPQQATSAPAEKKVTGEEIVAKVKDRFAIKLDSSRLLFLPLSSRKLVDDGFWRHFTLLGQSIGSIYLATEAMGELIPDVFLDTMGYAFAYPAVRCFAKHMPIGSYTHYPTISTDMLRRVQQRQAGHTNSAGTAGSRWRSTAKLVYYRVFAWIYSWALRRADKVVANGTWTRNHLEQLMNGSSAGTSASKGGRAPVQIVYPPCDTRSLAKFPLDSQGRRGIVSLAQFRPEKEHATQLRFLRALLDKYPELLKQEGGAGRVHLTMMGSCRNEGDEARIEMLKQLAKTLELEQHVSFLVNAPWTEICERLSKASIGISTMVDEHFGINVVEFMAAGLITLSHASAGPLLDIAVADAATGKPTGYHALTPADFADRAAEILRLSPAEEEGVRERARRRAQEVFGSEAFEASWRTRLWEPLVEKLHAREKKGQ